MERSLQTADGDRTRFQIHISEFDTADFGSPEAVPVRQQNHGPIAGRAFSRSLEQVEHFLGRENDHATALGMDGTDFPSGHRNYG